MQKANFAFLFSGGLKKKADPLINFPLLTKSVTWDTVCSVTDSDDEDDIDGGDVAERGMNGVCARPIWSSDLLYRGTATVHYTVDQHQVQCARYRRHTLRLLNVRGQRGIAGATTLTRHHRQMRRHQHHQLNMIFIFGTL